MQKIDRASILNLEERLESDLKKYMREGINNKMIKKYDIIGFEKAEKKITKLITKFGGQPIGIKESQWPISEI